MQVSSSEITVFIPTFNRHQWLKRAVESVLAETRIPILLHIFDNASTDGTEAYGAALSALDSRVRYTRQVENVGALENFRSAFQSVATEYFVPLADDDWLLPNYLFDAYQLIEQNKELGAVIYLTEGRTEQGEVSGQYPAQLDRRLLGFLTPEAHLRDWMRYGHYHWSSVLWRKNALDSIGFDFLDIGLPSDVDFQLQIFCRHPVYLTNRLGAVYGLHEAQASRGFNLSNLRSWVSVFARLDRTVRDRNIFSSNEYSQLRMSMQALFKGLWRLPAETALDERQLLSYAVLAGFKLGDWDFAYDLLKRYIEAKQIQDTANHIKNFVLPEISTTTEADAEKVLSIIPGLLPSLIAWFKLRNDRLRLMDGESHDSRTADIVLNPYDRLNQIEALNTNMVKWRTKAGRLKTKNERLRAKINSMRKERDRKSEIRLKNRICRWWKRVRGAALNL